MSFPMQHLYAIIGLAALCGVWVLFQRWISRADSEIGRDPHCGGGCSGDRLRQIDQNE